jgi:predicted anti-sigma-YlaC factor YlaD
MTCQEVIDFLSEYMDGTLPWYQRALFQAHLGVCRDCRTYLASFRQTMQLARSTTHSLEVDQLPPIPPELVQAIQMAKW